MRYFRFSYSLLFLLLFFCRVPGQVEGHVQKMEHVDRSLDEIKEMIDKLVITKVSKYDKNKYPKYFGVDTRVEKEMLIIFHCDYQCTREPALFLVYKNIDADGCKKISGMPLHAIGSTLFIGCEPSVKKTDSPD